MRHIGIVGSRKRTDSASIKRVVDDLPSDCVVVSGHAAGPDLWAEEAAVAPETSEQTQEELILSFLADGGEDFTSGEALSSKLGLSRSSDVINKDGHSANLMIGNVADGMWMRNSALDNPQFLATTIGNFLDQRSW